MCVWCGGATAQETAQQNEIPPQLEEMVVTEEAIEEPAQTYTAQEGRTATKTNATLLETPQAVSNVTRKLMDDQNVRRLEDAIRNVSGVTVGGYYTDWDYYRIRGFDASFTTYIDGIREGTTQNLETFGLERVEVIKGPASTLYGQGPVGGMVNLRSKRPRPDFFFDTYFTAGSYEFYEPAFDFGGPLNDDKTLYGRLNVLYRNHESHVDFAEKESFYIAPSITWEIGPDTTLTLLGSFSHDWDLHDWPLPAKGTVLPNINGKISPDLFTGQPGWSNYAEQWRASGGYEFTHAFNDTLSLRQNLSVSHTRGNWEDLLYPSSLDTDERTLYLYPYDSDSKLDRFGLDTALDAEFDTGTIEHRLTFGVDYLHLKEVYDSQQIDYSDFPGSYVPIDLFDPVYGYPQPVYGTQSTFGSEDDQVGLYLLEQARLFDRLTLTLGGRVDFAWNDNLAVEESDEAFTPRVGLTYELLEGVAAYVNYSQSFNPQWSSTDAVGNPIEPETGENYEVGLKTSLLDGRLNTLLAFYHLTRENVATDNPTTVDPFDAIASGEQRSQGIELEGSYEIMPGWDFIAAYTYMDAEITKDNALPVGVRLAGAPEHTLSAWMKYTLQDGPMKGLGVGLGGYYYSDQEGDRTYSSPFTLPSYGIVNAALFYERNRLSAQVNFDNVFDEEHYVGAYNDLYVRPGDPFTVRATVSIKF